MPEVDPRQLLVKIAKTLKRLKIPYLVTGGIAVLVWGRPRFTADIDIVIELQESKASNLMKALRGIGKAGYIDEATIRDAIRRQNEFNFIDGDTGVKVDFWPLRRNDPFDSSRLKRKIAKRILGESVYFTSPEDLMLVKLKWYKESGSSRQMEDVESIVKISGDKLDKSYLKQWSRGLDIEEELVRVLEKI